MSEANKATAMRFYEEVVAQGNLDLIDELVHENHVEHEEFPGLNPGREGVKEFFGMFRNAFPDLKFTVEDMMADGDKVVARVTVEGTHRGPFLDMEPTGHTISVPTVDIMRFADGKMVEHWGVTNELRMMQDLGIIPEE